MVAVIGVPTAWAIGKNTVGSKQLKPSAVRNSDVANDAITSPKIADSQVTGADVSEESLGQVPNAARADNAQTADTASSAANAASAASAANAANADRLDGLNSTDFLPAGGKAADAEAVDGTDGGDLLRRSSFNVSTTPSAVRTPDFVSYFANTSQTNTFEFRAFEIRTTGTPLQFKVCNNGGGGTVPLVRYLDGVRSVIAAETNSACNTTFTVDAGEDFAFMGAGFVVWGVSTSTLTPAGNNFNLLGIDTS